MYRLLWQTIAIHFFVSSLSLSLSESHCILPIIPEAPKISMLLLPLIHLTNHLEPSQSKKSKFPSPPFLPKSQPPPQILSKRSLRQEKSNRPLPLFICHGRNLPWIEVCAFFNANKSFKLITTVSESLLHFDGSLAATTMPI